MESIKRVMLAVKAGDFDSIRYPVLASSKIDGIRATCVGGVLMSRTMMPIPNKFTQALLGKPEYTGIDGELVVGDAWDRNCMQHTMSGVMSADGEPDVKWYAFDDWSIDKGFAYRAKALRARVAQFERVVWLNQSFIRSPTELYNLEDAMLDIGFEGLVVRSIDGPYKLGRSTLREGYMLKIKRFEDSEAEILDYYELMHNDNEATTDERGYTKRSSAKYGKQAANTLGGFIVRDVHTNVEFEIGTGFNALQRANLWAGAKYLKGKIVKYKYFPVGVVDKPRHPVFLGFRDVRDM